jgi:hypothetical protein
MCAILQIFFATALPDLTSLAISNENSTIGNTSVTIDVFRLQVESELFGIQGSRFLPGGIVVILGGQNVGQSEQTRPQYAIIFDIDRLSFRL